jgi:hypothetical protein
MVCQRFLVLRSSFFVRGLFAAVWDSEKPLQTTVNGAQRPSATVNGSRLGADLMGCSVIMGQAAAAGGPAALPSRAGLFL